MGFAREQSGIDADRDVTRASTTRVGLGKMSEIFGAESD
jgi:hypothetical protein